MRLLCFLASRSGKAVTRQEIIEEVWDGAAISDDALNSAVSKLRKALGEEESPGVYVETIPKVGYRLATSDDKSHRWAEWTRPGLALAASLCLSATALIWFLWPAPAALPAASAGLKIRPLTSYLGMEVDPAYGPNDRIAFAWKGPQDDNWDLYLLRADEGSPRRLTNHPGADQQPAWSRDGRRLAYLRLTSQACEVRILSAEEWSDLKVADCWSNEADSLEWSPDQQGLVLADRPRLDQPFRLVRIDLRDKKRTALTHPPAHSLGDFSAAYSPDGRWLAFSRSPIAGVEDIWLMPAQGGQERRLTKDGFKVHGLDWHSDSRSIVFASNRGGIFSLWSLSPEGSSPRLIASGSQEADSPSLSPDSRRLVYVDWRSRADIHRIDLGDPQSEPRTMAPSTRWDWSPAPSPDEGRLAFVSDRSGHPEVWISGPEGRSPRRLTQLAGPFIDHMSWSPDGQFLTFEARWPDGSSIMWMETDQSPPRRLAPGRDRQAAPSWSSHGLHIYFASDQSGDWQVWKAPVGEGPAAQVTQNGGFAARESLDGARICFTKADRAGLWCKPSQGPGEEALVIEGLQIQDARNWVMGSQFIYFPKRRPNGYADLMSLDIASGRVRQVASLGRLASHSGLSLSRPSRRVYFSRIESLESDIMLLDWQQVPPSADGSLATRLSP